MAKEEKNKELRRADAAEARAQRAEIDTQTMRAKAERAKKDGEDIKKAKQQELIDI